MGKYSRIKKKGPLKKGDRVKIVKENEYGLRVGKKGTFRFYTAEGTGVWVNFGLFGGSYLLNKGCVRKCD